MPASAVISVLARSLLAGDALVDDVHARAVRTLGRSWRWLGPLARRYVEAFAGGTRPRHRDVVRFLVEDSGFQGALRRYRREVSIAEWLAEPQRMQPVAVAQGWDLPVIETAGDLADWLCLSVGELEWFADLKELGNKLHQPKLQHYHYRILPKRSGGVRLIESPKPWLKTLQRRILAGILGCVPAHPAVHGFVKGRSIATFAAPHVGRQAVLRLDLQDFFPAFPAARAQALFRTLGYPESVADRLGGICTNAVPGGVWRNRPPDIGPAEWQKARDLYGRPHLPQGAPTSPALANLTAYRLDCRLSGLAKSAGAVYTRYADDLAFSGGDEFSRAVGRFATHAAAIALEEGFSVNFHKTRILRQGVRQQIAGVVVNQKLSLRRCDLELLEAILTNCVRHGPESQNRSGLANFRAHLEGRVGFVEMINREKGRRLRELFDAVRWEGSVQD
ncbi:MAG TPA: reverse transcriptase family protein [Bryobacteraceae bacterium]|nr:reverse transcriptase family protein [Bryobacteraceae bacterium]